MSQKSPSKKSVSNESFTEILYNIGSIFSYVNMIIFIVHALTLVHKKERVHFLMIGLILCAVSGAILTLPYKWDKRSMRIKALISISINLASLGLYLYTLTF